MIINYFGMVQMVFKVREVNHVETMIERSEKMKERRRRTSDLKTQSDVSFGWFVS